LISDIEAVQAGIAFWI